LFRKSPAETIVVGSDNIYGRASAALARAVLVLAKLSLPSGSVLHLWPHDLSCGFALTLRELEDMRTRLLAESSNVTPLRKNAQEGLERV
jgi:hypothetical protein